MSGHEITEACSCGATFAYRGGTHPHHATNAAAAFRENHVHNMPPPPMVVACEHPGPLPLYRRTQRMNAEIRKFALERLDDDYTEAREALVDELLRGPFDATWRAALKGAWLFTKFMRKDDHLRARLAIERQHVRTSSRAAWRVATNHYGHPAFDRTWRP